MNESIVEEPPASRSATVAGTFLKNLQQRMQKLLQRTHVTFPKQIHRTTLLIAPRPQQQYNLSSERKKVPASRVFKVHWDVKPGDVRRLFRFSSDRSMLDGQFGPVIEESAGSSASASADELVLVATHLIAQPDVQRFIDAALQVAVGRYDRAHEQWHHKCYFQRRTAESNSESEWFIRYSIQVDELILLTQGQKEVLQRRPALLNLVRTFGLEDSMRFAQAEEQRRIVLWRCENEAQLPETIAESAIPDRATTATEVNVDMMEDQDSSQLTPLCNSIVD